MIRILHFIPAFSIGGVESLVMSLYRHIDKAKVQFDFLIETEEKLAVFDEIECLGGKIYRLDKLDKRHILQYVKQIKLFFDEYASNYSVVHCHHIERATVVLYYAKKHGIDFRIIHAHTDSIEDVKFGNIRKMFMRINNHLSTHWFACSEAAGEFQFGKDRKAFIVLKNAIDTDVFSFNQRKRDEVRKRMKIDDCFVVGHTGRFTYQKNHWKIIDVFYVLCQHIPSAHLLLVGDGPLKKEMEEKVKDLALEKVVTFTGARDDIADLLQAMDIFLLPSFYEGFCISILEAQSVGLPCVTSDVIPPEVQVINLVKKLPLNDSDASWASELLSCQENPRLNQSKQVVQSGYDSLKNAKMLQNFYLKHEVNLDRE